LTYLRRLVAVALVLALWAGGLPADAGEPSARELFKRGRKYEKKGDFANAYLLYAQAAAADPSRTDYWQRAQALQRKAMVAANVMPLLQAAPTTAAQEQPPVELPKATVEDLTQARRPQPPIELAAPPLLKSFQLKSDSKSLWEQVTKEYGLEVIFDGDYEAGTAQEFEITDADYRVALTALMAATGSFFVPISSRVLLVVRDTEAKRKEVENTVSVTIPIPAPVTVQEAQELGRAVQQLMEIQRFAIDSAQRLVILRDRVSKVRPAQLVFQQLMGHRAQIVVDVELLAANKSSTLGLGLGLPSSFSIVSLVKTVALKGGPWSFALNVFNANVLATATRSEARVLYRAQIRSVEGEAAALQVGSKYPIMNMSYIGDVPDGETAFVPPPSFNFEDLGLNVKLTPKVHGSEEVTLDLEAEFKLLGAESLNGIPVISNRRFATQVRLRFDEAAIISGLVSKNQFKTMSGPAGLLNIPVIGTILGTSNWTNDDVQLLLVIKPHLISTPPSELATRDIWIGSESRPRIPL
jgi:general secretion pathway protein D